VTRTLVTRELDGESACFPLAAQAARICRQRQGKPTETVELITSRPANELTPAQWMDVNIAHWAIETGLHARLDASRQDDRCRLRRSNAVRIHGMFNRWADSLFMHWRGQRSKNRHLYTSDFLAHMSENHDRRALRSLTSVNFPL